MLFLQAVAVAAFVPLTTRPASNVATRATPLVAREPSPPSPPLSSVLLLGDAGALITYFLGLSSARTLALAVPGTDVASDADLVSGVTRFLLQSDLNLTVECVCEAS